MHRQKNLDLECFDQIIFFLHRSQLIVQPEPRGFVCFVWAMADCHCSFSACGKFLQSGLEKNATLRPSYSRSVLPHLDETEERTGAELVHTVAQVRVVRGHVLFKARLVNIFVKIAHNMQ